MIIIKGISIVITVPIFLVMFAIGYVTGFLLTPFVVGFEDGGEEVKRLVFIYSQWLRGQ